MNGPVLIKLRHKYLHVANGRFHGGEKPAPRKTRHKIGGVAHIARFGEPVPRTLVVNPRGRARIEVAA